MPVHLVGPALIPEDAWFKSSYSDAMQNCLEAAWFKSSYSDPGQNCLKAAPLPQAIAIAIRDSKSPTTPALLLPTPAWSAFIAYVGQEER
ncbi:DUF397 domain-containing protein [Streptomyces sp. NPDC057877]|uniref:DUF397 domain-containing protein n=1 Tax=Streptomyces sp. NPDC057877 TaxID=3346269 RepID=UPI0036932909